ncbi:hypothetical protein YPPY54_2265, partial [Yersinia pestis PY-54]
MSSYFYLILSCVYCIV